MTIILFAYKLFHICNTTSTIQSDVKPAFER